MKKQNLKIGLVVIGATGIAILSIILVILIIKLNFENLFNDQHQTTSGVYSCMVGECDSEFALTQTEADWISEHYMAVVESIIDEYPIESVRLLVEDAYWRAGTDFNQVFAPFDHEATNTHYAFFAQAVHLGDAGPVIFIYLPILMETYEETKEYPKTYEDFIITTFLHEVYHADHHLSTNDDLFENLSYEERLINESEARWYITKNVMMPMRENDRLSGMVLETDEQAIAAYLRAEGDSTSKFWQNYIKTVVRE